MSLLTSNLERFINCRARSAHPDSYRGQSTNPSIFRFSNNQFFRITGFHFYKITGLQDYRITRFPPVAIGVPTFHHSILPTFQSSILLPPKRDFGSLLNIPPDGYRASIIPIFHSDFLPFLQDFNLLGFSPIHPLSPIAVKLNKR